MNTWQQEMGWYCSTCKKLNRGRHKECLNCGKPKGREPFVDLPDEGEGIDWAIEDPDLLKQAKAVQIGSVNIAVRIKDEMMVIVLLAGLLRKKVQKTFHLKFQILNLIFLISN